MGTLKDQQNRKKALMAGENVPPAKKRTLPKVAKVRKDRPQDKSARVMRFLQQEEERVTKVLETLAQRNKGVSFKLSEVILMERHLAKRKARLLEEEQELDNLESRLFIKKAQLQALNEDLKTDKHYVLDVLETLLQSF